jgi:hypothetical protein
MYRGSSHEPKLGMHIVHGSGAFCDIERCFFSAFGCYGSNVLTVKPARERSGGVIRSENVDMSSDKQGERPCRRKSKGSCLKLI